MTSQTKKVKIDTIEGRDIFFDKYSERFVVGKNEYSSLSEAGRGIKRDLETEFKGEYYIHDSFDGILKFTAQRKIYDDYEGEYKIVGKLHRSVGNNRGEFKEEDLYPVSAFNKSQEEKAGEMNRKGWSLINSAKRLQLKK